MPFTNVLGRFARLHHNQHPGERLIIWEVSHYDTITTYFKNHVAHIDQKEHVPVDYDGGLAIAISPNGQAHTILRGRPYAVELTERGTRFPVLARLFHRKVRTATSDIMI